MIYLLPIIQIVFFFWYIGYIWIILGVWKSISDAWYYVPNKSAFNIFASGVGLPMWAYSLLGFNDYAQFVFAIAGFFFFALAIASTIKSSDMVKYIHFVCTGLAIVFSFWGIYAQSGDWKYLLYALPVSVFIIAFVNKPMWWLEIGVFVLIITKIIILI